MRERVSLDFGWRFLHGDTARAEQIGFDDSGWQDVTLPHDYTIEGPFDAQNNAWNGYLPTDAGWYRRSLTIPDPRSDERFFIEFEGAYRNSTVWVNGALVGTHRYGYTGFIYDITPFLRPGGPNLIAVRIDPNADGGGKEGWWYEGCGIYRHVWLIRTAPVHVANWGAFIATPAVSESEASVRVTTTIQNDSESFRDCMLETDILDPQGTLLFTLVDSVHIAARTSEQVGQETIIRHPLLWSPDAPRLYTAETRVLVDGQVVDTYSTPFGLRWFEFAPDRGFFLNGKHLQLRGMCIHHDYGGLGVALPDRAHEKNVEVMKEMGCNLLRSAHNDAAPALMDACDRLGMLVWAETRYLDTAEVAVPPLRDLIHRNRNHPSIICWGLANTAGSPDGKLTEYLRVLNDIAHEEDPYRPTAFACEGNTDANANGFAFVTDIMGYNGGGMGIDDRDHELYPERRMLISEFSSGRGARGIYEVIPCGEPTEAVLGDGRVIQLMGQYCSTYDLCRAFEAEWSHIAERPWLAGGAMWSGFEYWGETSGWPTVTSQFGILDICRFPKDAYYYFLQEWTRKPMVHIFPHWDHRGSEGLPVDVWCYSNCEQVELLLNGESMGVQATKPLTHLEWRVSYQQGVLCARGIIGEKIICTHEVRTSGDPAALSLTADRDVTAADGRDIRFVTISVRDSNGLPVPTACDDIEVSVTGCGRLIGLCSGDPRSHENPKGHTMRAFSGLLLAVVQSDGSPGEIVVTATSGALAPGSLNLNAR